MKYIKLFESADDFYSEFSTLMTDGIKEGVELTLYHASESPRLRIAAESIHIGTLDQASDRVDILWDHAPTYWIHEIKIRLSDPCPRVLMEVDRGGAHTPADFTKYGDWNEFVYRNRSEGWPEEEANLSIFILDLSLVYLDSRVVEIIDTRA